MRGYQKRVIYLKNTGSPLFEEAYFVIKSDGEGRSSKSSTTLVQEANKIIEENVNFGKVKRKIKISRKNALIFSIGFITASLMLIFLALLLKVI